MRVGIDFTAEQAEQTEQTDTELCQELDSLMAEEKARGFWDSYEHEPLEQEIRVDVEAEFSAMVWGR